MFFYGCSRIAVSYTHLDVYKRQMLEKGYLGLDVDFEYVEERDKEAFFHFLGRARERLHQDGFFLHVDLAPKTHAPVSYTHLPPQWMASIR